MNRGLNAKARRWVARGRASFLGAPRASDGDAATTPLRDSGLFYGAGDGGESRGSESGVATPNGLLRSLSMGAAACPLWVAANCRRN